MLCSVADCLGWQSSYKQIHPVEGRGNNHDLVLNSPMDSCLVQIHFLTEDVVLSLRSILIYLSVLEIHLFK